MAEPVAECRDDASADAFDSLAQQRADAFVELVTDGGASIDRCCVDCGATELLEYDHVPDHRQTGRTVVEELRLRCAPCHRRRHARERG